jgi:hypothetical protein
MLLASGYVTKHRRLDMKSIPLTKGRVALIDDEDYERVSQYKWCLSCGRYAQSKMGNRRNKPVYLHRFIMNAQPGQEVDHINRNTLDNRRSNLRFCSHQKNMANSVHVKKGASGYRGVFLDKRRGTFYAQVVVNGKAYTSSGYRTAKEAAIAYNKMNNQHNGEFGILNEV